jgi:hypothetical protein
MAEAEIRSGASTEVKALAARIITVQEAELRQMHVWRDAWSSDSRGPSRGHRHERHAWFPMAPSDLLTPFTGLPPPHLRPRSASTMAVRTTGLLVRSAERTNDNAAAADAARDHGLVPDARPGPADGRKARSWAGC